MPTKTRTENLLANPLECCLGRLSLAGIIRHGSGVPFSTMRRLGGYALVYLLKGAGRYADAAGRQLKLSPGDCLTLFPDIPHAYGPGPTEVWDEIFIVFDGPAFDLWRQIGLLDSQQPLRRLLPLEYWFDKLKSIGRSPQTQSSLLIICRIQQLLAEMQEYESTRAIDEADRVFLARAKILLQRPVPLGNFDLESIATELSCSYVGFRKRFARLTGVSPGRFHMQSVMTRACDLLRRHPLTNAQLAHRLGFCDEFHFSRRFKQIIGLSPKEFRRFSATAVRPRVQ